MMVRNVLLQLLVFFCGTAINSQTIVGYPEPGDTVYVFSANGLNLRNDISLSATIIDRLTHAQSVLIIEDEKNYTFLDEYNRLSVTINHE